MKWGVVGARKTNMGYLLTLERAKKREKRVAQSNRYSVYKSFPFFFTFVGGIFLFAKQWCAEDLFAYVWKKYENELIHECVSIIVRIRAVK